MKKAISLILILSLIFSLSACGKKKKSDIEVVKEYESQTLEKNYNGEQKTALNPTGTYDFKNGYAWISIESGGSKTYHLIDTSGKIIYTSTSIYAVHDMSNDACFVQERISENKYVYKIINKNGQVVASSADGKFDEILVSGDNLFFVHKYEGSIESSRHLYGTVNEKGEFVNQLREAPSGVVLNYLDSKYIGGKAFLIGSAGYIYMSSIDKYFGKGIKTAECIGNDLYLINDGRVQAEGSEKEYNKYFDHTYDCVVIHADGTIGKAPKFEKIVSGLLITREKDAVSFNDPTTGKTSVFSKYYITDIEAADNNVLLKLEGKDGKNYFTVIDKNCNILFEPVAGYANAGDGKVSINTTDGYAVLDYSGNVLINPGTYKPIRAFNSGIAWAKNSSDQYVGIDEKGNVVIS